MNIRIDDYPTGVKPILSNKFNQFRKVLQLFEDADIYYHLGVVPKLIDKEDIKFLNSLTHCIVCMHGVHHNFYTWSKLNEDREEFRGKSVDEIVELLKEGQEILKDTMMSPLYIPTFNQINQNLVEALIRCNFRSITTGVNPPNVDYKDLLVYTPKDIFYGTSSYIYDNINDFKMDDHIGLHLTWEVEESKSDWKLPAIINHIQEVL